MRRPRPFASSTCAHRVRASAARFALAWLALALAGAAPAAAAPALLDSLDGGACSAIDVNDAGGAAGHCRTADGDFVPTYWAGGSAAAMVLAGLETGSACHALGIARDGQIAGNCERGEAGMQWPVRWTTPSLPAVAPETLKGRIGDDRAEAWQINASGAVAGISTTPGGSDLPVVWKRGQTAATALPLPGALPPLLSPVTECRIAALDPAPEPVVAGTCELRQGGTAAVQWRPNALGGYSVAWLPRPLGSSNCLASAINASGHVAGTCADAAGDLVAVRWTSPREAPALLRSVPRGARGQQLFAVDINAAGVVAGHYISEQGLARSFAWAPSGEIEREDALDLGTLGGALVHASRIADNGRIIGTAETAQGAQAGFAWSPTTDIADLGTLGGPANQPLSISPNGRWIVGISAIATGQRLAYRIGPLANKLTHAGARALRATALADCSAGASLYWNQAPAAPACSDKGTGCPSRAYLCNNSVYASLMGEQCPRTCGRCGLPRT